MGSRMTTSLPWDEMYWNVETVAQAFGLAVSTVRKAAEETGYLVPGVRAINFGTENKKFWRFSSLEIRRHWMGQ
jgi:hypothetical protein